ncbi:ABC transporter permease [Prosthecochloris sp. ZM]|uniref:Binding-protein-dependent transport systems inner membrane component n=2 Tax=Prosthecochloris TaxID=1101 RepID=B4S5I0_PROA2|nr:MULTISPECIES: ABC transporter permease [Prosthecochloris]ACF45577.1 binding-protein-dependent transport systems inner membrane component [Prosthecochloris aestuarii DSM 271]NEX11646.1 ABC transporter permease [Prosthecochloris sp.]RDD30906.1 ABC transporter permease [Prosthecochloris sp. ZM]
MLLYIFRRLLVAVPLIFGVLTLTFFIIRLAPGDPAAFFIQPGISPNVAEQIREQYGLNDPVYIQYFKWLANIFQGDFGRSFSRAQQPVVEVIAQALPITVTIALLTLIANFVLGIAIGVISAVRQNSVLDRVLTVTALFFYSMPEFWFALMMIIIFALKLQIFPASGLNEVGAEFLGPVGFVLDRIWHLVLPVTVLSINGAAGIARYVRGSMLEVIRQDYIRTARAKGLPEKVVVLKHALRNALLPVITLIGGSLPFIFSGALFIEVIFAFPGMGRVTVEAIFARDYPLIIANTFISGTLIIFGNLLADVLYAVVDPRIKL